MCKKLLSIFLSVITIFSLGTIANAQSNIATNLEPEIQPYYEYTSYDKATLNISSGQAICESSLTGYSDITTKINITMYLEKKTLWWWSTETSWSTTYYNYRGTLSEVCAIDGGTYRVKAVYTVYSGNASETITGYSSEVKY